MSWKHTNRFGPFGPAVFVLIALFAAGCSKGEGSRVARASAQIEVGPDTIADGTAVPDSDDGRVRAESTVAAKADVMLLEGPKSGPVPAPVFDLRISNIGTVRETRRDLCIEGKPRRVDYQGWTITRSSGEVARKKRISDSGFAEYDQGGRQVVQGGWSAGTTVAHRFAFGEDGTVTQMCTIVGKKPEPLCVSYHYQTIGNSVVITSKNGEVEGRREVQVFNEKGEMIQDVIDDLRRGATYVYRYDDSGRIVSLTRYKVRATVEELTDANLSNEWRFEYDEAGRVAVSTNIDRFGGSSRESSARYTYDKEGNIETVSYGPVDRPHLVTYTYVFDRFGNWIRRTNLSATEGDDTTLTGYEIERTISYFE